MSHSLLSKAILLATELTPAILEALTQYASKNDASKKDHPTKGNPE